MEFLKFEEKWNSIPKEFGLLQQIDQTSKLNFGRDFNGNKVLVANFFLEPKIADRNSSFTVEKVKLEDKWRISIYLNNIAEQDVFIIFLWDIFNCSINIFEDIDLIDNLKKRLSLWSKLFENKGKLLSVETVQGLIGELLFLKNIASEKYGLDESIYCWGGPLGDDQDFTFDGEWNEIKTIRFGKEKFSVSSIEQLDVNRLGKLYLIEVDKVSNELKNSVNLYDLVNDINNTIQNVDTRIEFERRLALVGYFMDEKYREITFSLKRIRDYIVDKHFPKITRIDTSPEIINAIYTISITAIESYRGKYFYES